MGQSGSSEHRGGSAAGTGLEGGGTYTQKNVGANSEGSGTSPHKPPWAGMEGPVYGCDYLGFKTLPKPITNISGLQSTVKDLYMQFRRNMQQGGPSKKSSFKITPGGLLVSLHESGGPLEMFFDLNSVNFIQAVRFAIVKGSEKKPKALFLPLEENRGSVSDKSAFSLDKSFHFLVHANHQPLLVCVLRRPKGVKALDCHVFALDSPENVLYVQSLVQQLMSSGTSGGAGDAAFNRGGTRGDFIRTEFGEYNVYRGGTGQAQTFELKDEYFRGGGGGGGGGSYPPHLEPGPRSGGHPSPRETYPAESSERPRFGWSYDKPQSGDEFRRISGNYGPDNGRPVSGELRAGHQYPPDSRGSNPYSPDSRQGNQFFGDNRGVNQYPGDRRSGEMADGYRGAPASYEQGYRRGEFERPDVSHVRERSGDSSDMNRVPGLNRKVSSGSDHSGGGGGRRHYDDVGPSGRGGPQDSRFGPVSPRSEGPPRVLEKPVSPVRVVQGSAFSPTSPTGGHTPLSPRHSGESPRSPVSPYSPSGPPPHSAGLYNDGPAFSLSNRESRDDGPIPEPSQPGKPVAKVPPHLKGVKVLPSDFLAVKLKPKQQRAESEDSDHGYDNQKNIMAQYKLLQEQESQQGFTSFDDGDLDKPSKTRSYTNNWNEESVRGGGGNDPSSGSRFDTPMRRFPPNDEDRRYIEQYSDQDTVQMRPPHGHSRYEDSGKNRYNPGGAGFRDNEPGPSGGADWRSQQPSYDVSGGQGYSRGMGSQPGRGGLSAPSSSANDESQLGRKKDAEIASMFTNFSIHGRQDGFNPDRNNFEESLGYLP